MAKISTVTLIAGLILVAIGSLMFYFFDSTSKFFALSNDIIGAGILSVTVALVILSFGAILTIGSIITKVFKFIKG